MALAKEGAAVAVVVRNTAVLAKNEYSTIAFVNALLLAAVGPKVGEATPFAGLEGLAASYASIGHAK